MQPQPEASVISDRKKFRAPTIFLTVVIVFTVSVVAVISIRYINSEKNYLAKENETIARIITEAQKMEIVFTAVPDALQLIAIPAPPNSESSDNANYIELKPTATVPEDIVQNDVAFNMYFLGMTYGKYLNSIENPGEIYQITDELHELALKLNNQFNRPSFATRFAEVIQMAPLDPISPGSEVHSVYPSIRAIDAYLAAHFMSKIDPENEQEYNQEAQALVSRGIGYGLYSESDAEAAALLVSQYLTLYSRTIQ